MDKRLKLCIAFTILLVFWGCGSSQDISGKEKVKRIDNSWSPSEIIKADTFKIREMYEAVGTIKPKTESRIESQIQAQVLKVKVTPGKEVKRGDVLVLLDNRTAGSKLGRAEEGLKKAVSVENQRKEEVAAANAFYNQAESDYKRIRKYYQSDAATKRDLEKAESSYLQSKANLKRAKQALNASKAGIRSARQQVKEAEVGMEYTRITAPEDGEVLKRMVEPGDLALPGKPLFIIQTSGSLRIEAYVREGLITSAVPGENVNVRIDTLKSELQGIIEEIVPYADPETRTFLVKASIPPVKGIFPGMYGKLLIPSGEKEVVMIPEKAILKVGQLEMVNVRVKDEWIRVYVKTGSKNRNGIEILSGIEKGDEIGLEL